jgi:hypothetical protein
LEHDAVFTEMSPLARSTALAQRLLTPLTFVKTFTLAGHELSKRKDFEPALAALETHSEPGPKPLASCREYKEKKLEKKLQEIHELWEPW